MHLTSDNPTPLTVGELTGQIRDLLEGGFSEVLVQGEVSNFRSPGSGHLYFTLKDESAVLSAVMFRGDAARLRFALAEGAAVVAKGRITVYEARGQYQIQVQSLQLAGQGTLQQQFEALKRKLEAEGLFDPDRKKPLPVFPEVVGIVTSLQGAVIQDFLRILKRRAPGIRIQVRGVRVQGEGASDEIVQAIEAFDRDAEVEVIVLARGGGSMEDLWEFNRETVARAIAVASLPIISAVGHETDFTIADFVADLRAPTPSAAAELISRDWGEWREEVLQWKNRLDRETRNILQFRAQQLRRLAESALFRDPIRIVHQLQQRIDDLQEKLRLGLKQSIGEHRHGLDKLLLRWKGVDPKPILAQRRERIRNWEARLKSLGPEATLKRGFAWVTDAEGKLVREASPKIVGKSVQIRMARGVLGAEVREVLPDAP